ncbi:Ig-like domain-containing protein, partial [Dyadobacter frigoris]|uniref:Ig-like domain-containing protein n=1 Tax=Dyadobacter frigoris TaxID=2576211 RepID=UPI004042C69C
WYDAATGGTGLATAPTPSTVTVGTKSYFVSQTLNGCEGPRAEIKVIVGACTTPAPTVVSPVNYNVGATATVLPAVANGLWYDVATGGTGLAAAPTPSTVTAGTKSYFVSQTLNGCEGPRAEIKVIVTCATPAPTVISPVNYNVGATATALPAVANGLWYDVATGGTGLAAAPTPSTVTAGTKSYFVSQTLNGCEV